MSEREPGGVASPRRVRWPLAALLSAVVCLLVAVALGAVGDGDGEHAVTGGAGPFLSSSAGSLRLAADPRLMPSFLAPGPSEIALARGASLRPPPDALSIPPPCLRGRVVDRDGRALVRAWIVLEESSGLSPEEPLALDAGGRFEACPGAGPSSLLAGAPDHQPVRIEIVPHLQHGELALVLLRESSGSR